MKSISVTTRNASNFVIDAHGTLLSHSNPEYFMDNFSQKEYIRNLLNSTKASWRRATSLPNHFPNTLPQICTRLNPTWHMYRYSQADSRIWPYKHAHICTIQALLRLGDESPRQKYYVVPMAKVKVSVNICRVPSLAFCMIIPHFSAICKGLLYYQSMWLWNWPETSQLLLSI